MSDDIRPTCIAVDGAEAVTGHCLPVANHWRVDNAELKHLGVLRGRHARITAVCIAAACAVVLVGYADGAVGVFASAGHQFVRVIQCHAREAVSQLVCRIGRAEIFAFQVVREATIVSKWSLNGSFLAAEAIEGEVKDVKMRGIEKDVLFVMSRSGEILVVSPTSLAIRSSVTYPIEFAEGMLSVEKEIVRLRTSTRESIYKMVQRKCIES
jgi:hypothetical protein